jgi:L-serine dehydratase
MFISVFDIFKIGIGPSSSHTNGPMIAAERFLRVLQKNHQNKESLKLNATLYGSLAFTGKGHATDTAISLGLLGVVPETLVTNDISKLLKNLQESKEIIFDNSLTLQFDPTRDIVFDYGPPLEGHANGMIFTASSIDGKEILKKTYYSIGGGFVLSEQELEESKNTQEKGEDFENVPYPFSTADEMLAMGKKTGLSIAQMAKENEQSLRANGDIQAGIDRIWAVMNECIERGLSTDGNLPGSLKVRRRAHDIYFKLQKETLKNSITPHVCNEFLSVYAMAVTEENAAGGQVATAPTNGAAGVIPSVIRYYLNFISGADRKHIQDFLLTASAVGGLIKNNASISGAEVGCQGEVGSASAMAAAGLCAVMGGTNEQIENAAEIALEHHLGMTCDPVAGLVQVPCIERNGLGAVKAVTAAALALRGDGTHFVSLDNCVETMRQTGEDMSTQYKETSQGGLAVNIVEC